MSLTLSLPRPNLAPIAPLPEIHGKLVLKLGADVLKAEIHNNDIVLSAADPLLTQAELAKPPLELEDLGTLKAAIEVPAGLRSDVRTYYCFEQKAGTGRHSPVASYLLATPAQTAQLHNWYVAGEGSRDAIEAITLCPPGSNLSNRVSILGKSVKRDGISGAPSEAELRPGTTVYLDSSGQLHLRDHTKGGTDVYFRSKYPLPVM